MNRRGFLKFLGAAPAAAVLPAAAALPTPDAKPEGRMIRRSGSHYVRDIEELANPPIIAYSEPLRPQDMNLAPGEPTYLKTRYRPLLRSKKA